MEQNTKIVQGNGTRNHLTTSGTSCEPCILWDTGLLHIYDWLPPPSGQRQKCILEFNKMLPGNSSGYWRDALMKIIIFVTPYMPFCIFSFCLSWNCQHLLCIMDGTTRNSPTGTWDTVLKPLVLLGVGGDHIWVRQWSWWWRFTTMSWCSWIWLRSWEYAVVATCQSQGSQAPGSAASSTVLWLHN